MVKLYKLEVSNGRIECIIKQTLNENEKAHWLDHGFHIAPHEAKSALISQLEIDNSELNKQIKNNNELMVLAKEF